MGCDTDLGIEQKLWRCDQDSDCIDGWHCDEGAQICVESAPSPGSEGGPYPENVVLLPVAGHEGETNLADGQPIGDFSQWATNANACFTGSFSDRYSGLHVLFALEEAAPGGTIVEINVFPEPDTDVSLYALTTSAGDHAVPPDVPKAWSCEVSHQDGAIAEAVQIDAGDKQLLFGVAGAYGRTEGGFQISVKINP